MKKDFEYITNLDIKFDHLEKFDVPQMVADSTDREHEKTVMLMVETDTLQPIGDQ